MPKAPTRQFRRRSLRLEILNERITPSGVALGSYDVTPQTTLKVSQSDVVPQVVEFDPVTRTERVTPLDAGVRDAYDREAYLTALKITQNFRGIDELLASLTAPGSPGLGGDLQAPPVGAEGIFPAGPTDQSGTPQSSSGAQETVLGSDDRTLITATTSYPWSAVGRLQITFPSGSGHCSGVMISPFHFLTAGHCVYNTDQNAWATDLVVTMGRDGTDRYFGEANWTTARSWTGWTVDENWEHDWALVTLDRSIGNQTGWLGYRTQTDTFFSGSTVNTAGYPGDIGSPVGQQMYFASGPSGFATSNKVYYQGTMDTFGGQSGSGVWQLESGNRYVVAVHAYGDGGNGYNSGTRITSAKFDQLQSWISGDTAPTDRPDLVDYDDWFSTDFAYTDSSGYQRGETLSANTYIRNNGTANTSGAWDVDFYASTNNFISTFDYPLGRVSMSSLAPFNWTAASAFASLPASMPTGTYYIGWLIDSTGQESEFDESNNSGYVSNVVTINNAQPQAWGIGTVDAFRNQTSNLNLPVYFSDFETGANNLQYAVIANDRSDDLSTSIQNGVLALSPTRKALGLASVTIRATDADGSWVDSTFTVDIHKNGYVGDFVDQDGDKYRVRVSGLGGARVTISDPDGDGRGPIDTLELLSTDAKKSQVSVSVRKSKTSADGGTVSIGGIFGQGANAIVLRKSSLTGFGISMQTGVGRLVAQDLADNVGISILGPADSKTSISLWNVGSGAYIYADHAIKSFRARSVGVGAVVDVPSIGTMSVSGDFAGSLYVSGTGLAAKKPAVRSLRVRGTVTDAYLQINGDISAVEVGGFRNSQLYAGYTGDIDGSGTFNVPATVKSFRVTGKDVGFRNSYVIATNFGSVWLRAAATSNGGTDFGFIADGAINRLKIVDPKYVYDPADPSIGNFRVKVI